MQPLVLTSVGRAIPALDGLAVDVRRVPLLPAVATLDAERPTVVWLDRALLDAFVAANVFALVTPETGKFRVVTPH